MRRREFITLLGGAATAWPLAARAQQPERMRRVGILVNSAENDQEKQFEIGTFRQRLKELGWTEGRNVRLDYRWAASDFDRARVYAAELLSQSQPTFRAPPRSNVPSMHSRISRMSA
jgi:putative ABC transport system substrate-binding protein